MLTARTIIERALRELMLLETTETPDAETFTQALGQLNTMLAGMALSSSGSTAPFLPFPEGQDELGVNDTPAVRRHEDHLLVALLAQFIAASQNRPVPATIRERVNRAESYFGIEYMTFAPTEDAEFARADTLDRYLNKGFSNGDSTS